MSIIVDLAAGFLKGLGGPDLKEWIDNLPGKLGEELGELIRPEIGKDGRLTDQGLEKVRDWMSKSSKHSSELAPLLLGHHPTVEHAGASVIPQYLELLNLIVSTMNSTGLPLVLQGFLHSDQCLSYWHFDQRDRGKLKEFEKHPSLDLISCHIGLEMYILEGDFSLERVKELNLEIRTSRFHKLEYTLYHSCPRIDTIKEFSLDLRIGESIPIPITFPGIGLMLTSIDGALEAQGQPSKNVKRALLSAREGKTTNA